MGKKRYRFWKEEYERDIVGDKESPSEVKSATAINAARPGEPRAIDHLLNGIKWNSYFFLRQN
jgi:hypothetical protein